MYPSKFTVVLLLFLTKKMSRSPSLSSSSESFYSYSEESEPDSFPEKPLLEMGRYYDTVGAGSNQRRSCRIS